MCRQRMSKLRAVVSCMTECMKQNVHETQLGVKACFTQVWLDEKCLKVILQTLLMPPARCNYRSHMQKCWSAPAEKIWVLSGFMAKSRTRWEWPKKDKNSVQRLKIITKQTHDRFYFNQKYKLMRHSWSKQAFARDRWTTFKKWKHRTWSKKQIWSLCENISTISWV